MRICRSVNPLISISQSNRTLGTYVCGNPGSGKSSLLQKCILHDIKLNRGVCVIDPTSQLIKTLISYIPASRKDDIVYFNTSMGVPLNFFTCRDDAERREFSTDLTNIIDLSAAPVASKYLRRIIRVFLEANHNGATPPLTLWDIPRFVQDQEFIHQVFRSATPNAAKTSRHITSHPQTALVRSLSVCQTSLIPMCFRRFLATQMPS